MVWPVVIGARAGKRPTLNPPPQGCGGQAVEPPTIQPGRTPVAMALCRRAEQTPRRRLQLLLCALGRKRSAADMQVALREGNLDAGFAEFLLDREIQVAFEAARPMTHFTAPHDQLEGERVFSELRQKHARSWIVQHVRIALPGRNQRGSHFVYIGPVRNS